MNCETIDSILDDHLVARLMPAERQRVAEHVGVCTRCSAAWAADDALRSETVAGPPPELFPALLRRVAAAPARREGARGLRFALAGAVTIAVVAVAARLAVVEPEATAPPSAVVSVPPSSAAAPFVAGRDYEVLPAAARSGAVVAGDEVEVIEFFMYPCFPCYEFEPDLVRWEAQTADRATLTRVPAMFYPQAELLARAYYTAQVLGKLDAMHAAFYDEIHARGNALASRAALAEFFERAGVDRATFDAAFDSGQVDARMQQAVALNREYAIRATPSVIVAGRYSTNPTLAGSLTGMLEIVDYLVDESAR